MKTNIRLFSLAVAGMLLCTSCIGDLDTLPLNESDSTSETVYGTDEYGYLAGLTKIYFQFVSNETTDLQVSDGGASELIRAFWSTQECTTDEAKCAWENDAWVRDLNENTWSEASNDATYAVYVRTLQGIAYVNEYLRQTSSDKLAARGVSSELAAKIEQFRDEARFLRAYFYWMALDTFGNVPFTTEESPFGGGVNPTQASRKDVFDYCIGELTYLASDQSAMPAARSNYPRADKGSVNGLLARMYLNAEVYTGTAMWQQAKDACEAVFNLGYELCPDYAALFRGDNGENPEALQEAERIGYPVMLKARSGGGGRGIRVIRSREELEKAYTTAEAESRAAFGDGALYLEKYIYPARHIEAQILADEEGHVLCLGERDCSVQRNHQKLIEESPSPAVDAAMRERLVELVREAVPKIGYTGAGTLEFLLDSRGNFWFMEMNLRLQVEHGVTEMLTGVDLVKWQIRTAAGIALNQRQEDVILNGSCIECRINARSTGKVTALHVPGGPFVRFDTFLAQGAEITPFYDPLLGKLIVRAGTREEAVRKMKAALCELVIEGVETNLEEQLALVNEPEFADGSYDLRFMESR